MNVIVPRIRTGDRFVTSSQSILQKCLIGRSGGSDSSAAELSVTTPGSTSSSIVSVDRLTLRQSTQLASADLKNIQTSTRLIRDGFPERESVRSFDNGMTKRMIGAGRAVDKVEFVAFADGDELHLPSDLRPHQRNRQCKRDSRFVCRNILSSNLPAVRLDDRAADRQPKAGTLFASREVRLED